MLRSRLALPLAALAGLGFAALATPSEARRPAPSAVAAPGVAVDVSLLRQRGFGEFSDVLGSVLLQQLHAEGVTAQPGTRIVVQLSGYSMRIFSSAQDGGGLSRGGATNNDYLEGDTFVLGPRGEVLQSFRTLLALPASYGGSVFTPEASEERRVVGIARTYAQWVKRDLR